MLALFQSLAFVLFLAQVPSVTPDPYPPEWRGKGEGNTYVLYRRHNVQAMSQGEVGSCVGTATAKALELMHGRKFSAEWLYGRSREHFGKEIGAGSNPAWAAQVVRDIGAVPAANYSAIGYNLSIYNPATASAWERGPPETLDWIASRYRSPGLVKITTWEQLRDAISQGIPVIYGGCVGFGRQTSQVRDRNGLLYPRWWSRWRHSMTFCGVSDGNQKQALVLNSWGSGWVVGPKWVGDEPDGSFWVTKDVAQRMLNCGQSYAILPLVGIDENLYEVR